MDFLTFLPASVAFPTRSARIDSFRNQLEWVLDDDVRQYFPDSEAVNKALRGLIALIPEKR